MGDVIQVDFAAQKAAKQATTEPPMNAAQAAMVKLCEMQLSAEEFVELSAALHDYDCYNQACAHVRLLVDVYQMLEAF